MNRKRYGDLGVRFGAILLACFVWLYAATELNYRTQVSVRLNITDPPSDETGQVLTIANDIPHQVIVNVFGRGRDILRLKEDAFLLRVQVPALPVGSIRKFRLSPEHVIRNTELDVRVEEIVEPLEVEVHVDRLLEANIPVKPFVDIQTAESYTQVGTEVVTPETVSVTGPAEQIGEILVLQTDSLVRVGVRDDIMAELALLLPPIPRMRTDVVTIAVHVDVQELAEYDIANVPIRIANAGERSVTAEPSRVTVRVRGGADVIGKIDPETDIELYIDFAQAGEFGRQSVLVAPGTLANYEIRQITPAAVSLVLR